MPRHLTPLLSKFEVWFKTMAVFCFTLLLGLSFSASAAIATELSHAPETAQAYIIEPADGDTVSPNFTVKFGLSGMGVAPAGVERDNTGHHHLLIDVAELPELTEPLAATEQIKHFGGGQTEAQIDLEPGEHTLRLLLGNYSHIPHDNPVLSSPITVSVQ